MAESKDNYVIKGLSGNVGKLLTFRQRAGKTVISKFPRPSSIPPTDKLRSNRANFATCIAYAKAAIKDPAVKAKYQAAAVGGQTAFNVATSDALNRLSLTEIEQAIKNFKKTTVTISIQQATGELLEQGTASLKPGTTDWLYKRTKANPMPAGSRVTVTATDLPETGAPISIVLT
jgi:hypothetical protein